MRAAFVAPLALAFVLLAAPARAHKPSDAYLTLRPVGQAVNVRWDLALRDLDGVVGLDGDGDGSITWSEARAAHAAVLAYALPRLSLRVAAGACAASSGAPRVVEHADGTYLVLELAFRCPGPAAALELGYDALFERDASHRGIARVAGPDASETLIFTEHERVRRVTVGTSSRLTALSRMTRLGMAHIFAGYDHLAFLVALLLPAVLRRDGRRWLPVPSFRPMLRDVARTVTAFTLAHSLTLGLAVLGLVLLPVRWVESAIALSVVLAAANNLWPLVRAERWLIAFELGLLHGFGFASALGDAGLERAELTTTLFGFNAGVELGQLLIVLGFLPLAYALRRRPLYVRWGLGAGSALVAAVALVWFVERSCGLRLIS